MRILLVAMPNSIHTARWTQQLVGSGHDVHLFGVTATPPHENLRSVTVSGFSRYRTPELAADVRLRGAYPFSKGAWHVAQPLVRHFPRWLAATIRRVRPDVVHSLEIQHAAYLTLEARRRVAAKFPPWIVTNWGSDIYHFHRVPEHALRIREVLESCDYYTCECERDVGLARKHGFRGEVLLVAPNAGGIDLDDAAGLRQPGPTSSRRVIVVKGYQDWAGRALVALEAIERCADLLRPYRIVVHLADAEVGRRTAALQARTGLKLEVASRRPHREMLRLYGSARISVGLSVTDGISTSSLEALAMGAFPIQSTASCLNEWVRCGETGFLVDAEDVDAVTRALRRAAVEDALVDRAAELNARTVAARLDRRVIEPQVLAMYERVAADVGCA
ncbi:MAG: glycosyltransferase [Gaiellaceae bacterium]